MPSKQTTQQQLQERSIEQLRIIGGQLTKDDDVTFEGNAYIFPERYKANLVGLAEDVVRYVQSMGEIVVVQATLPYRPFDGAYAATKCLKEFFGYASSKARETPWGDEPPQEITIPLGYENGELIKETVPWGDMVLPGLPGATLTLTSVVDRHRGELFHMTAKVRKVEKPVIDGFFKMVERKLEQHSIYRGKAIDGGMEFIDTDKIDPDQFVYTEEAWANAQVNFLSPLVDRAEIIRNGLSKKRVTLLEGPYGTGKTGMLRTALKTAVQNGATAIMCRPGVDHPINVLQTAILYAGDTGVVVCIEDIDVYAAQNDPQIMSKILDMFDGPQTKGLPVTVVMTTNHVDEIHKGMMRSGRIDAVMHIGEMDRPGVERLGQLVLGDNLAPDVDWDQVFEATDGFMPAYVREGMERSLRYTIATTGKAGAIETKHIVFALNSLRPQYDLQAKAKDRRKELPAFDAVFQDQIRSAVTELDITSEVSSRVYTLLEETEVKLVDQENEHTIHGKLFPS